VADLQNCLRLTGFLEDKATGFFGNKTKLALKSFQKKYNLTPDGLVGKKTRDKLNSICKFEPETQKLEFNLITASTDKFKSIANIIKDQLSKIGIKINIQTLELSEFKTKLKKRDYDMVLFGQVLSLLPDFYPFWHSDQASVTGLNISNYKNDGIDKLIVSQRTSLNNQDYKKYTEKIQDKLLEDLPMIPLYNPNTYYFFNLDNKILSDKNVRKAIAFSINKKEIIKSVYNNDAKIINSPILSSFFGFTKPKENIIFDIDTAKDILKKAGFKENKEGELEKIFSQICFGNILTVQVSKKE